MVAAIAEEHLTPTARAAVNALLRGHSLASISSWADQVRRTRPETYNWHFVDIPLEASAYEARRDCKPSPKGDCVVAAINRGVEALRDPHVTGPERVQALMFLVHFVGDIHQPLHASEGKTATGLPDRGGNLIPVDFYGQETNLHRVWDSELISHSGETQAELLKELSALAESLPRETFTSTSAASWATESHQKARTHTYGDLPQDFARTEPSLGDAYEEAELPTLKKQLALAGYHLALALNAAFPP
jgi:S1/P1 Nuclease